MSAPESYYYEETGRRSLRAAECVVPLAPITQETLGALQALALRLATRQDVRRGGPRSYAWEKWMVARSLGVVPPGTISLAIQNSMIDVAPGELPEALVKMVSRIFARDAQVTWQFFTHLPGTCSTVHSEPKLFNLNIGIYGDAGSRAFHWDEDMHVACERAQQPGEVCLFNPLPWHYVANPGMTPRTTLMVCDVKGYAKRYASLAELAAEVRTAYAPV